MKSKKFLIKIKVLSAFVLAINLIFFGTAFLFNLTATPAYGQAANAWNLQRDTSDTTNNPLNFFYSTGGAKVLTIRSGGNVGVGITAPATKLQVLGTGQVGAAPTFPTGNQGGTLFVSDLGTSPGNGGMLTLGNSNGTNSWGYAGIKGYFTDATSNGIGDMIFLTRNTTADPTLTERMRILSSGYVGIGTGTPASKLDVNGGFRCCGTAANLQGLGTQAAGAAGLGIGWNGSGYMGEVDFYSLLGATTNSAFRFYSYTSTANPDMALPILTLNRDGRVGIRNGAPGSDLHIKQSTDTWATGGITLERAGSNANKGYIVMGGDDNLYFGANNAAGGFTKYMLLDSNGTLRVTGQVFANGVQLTSSKTKKENFKTINYQKILDKIDTLSIMNWNYKDQDPSIRHIGPFAEDFYTAFGLNNDDKTISITDEGGVALVGVKALSEQVKNQQTEIDLLKKEIEELKSSK
jgi:hypothetical protein